MNLYAQYFESNRVSWNKRTNIHKDSAFYDLASFKKGKSSLNKIELEGVGPVTGKSIATPAMSFWNGHHELVARGSHCYGC